jgi:hypothetical protein
MMEFVINTTEEAAELNGISCYRVELLLPVNSR